MYGDYLAGPRTTQVSEQNREAAIDKLIETALTPEDVVEACMGLADTIYEWLMAEHYDSVRNAVADEYEGEVDDLAAKIQREADAEGGYDG